MRPNHGSPAHRQGVFQSTHPYRVRLGAARREQLTWMFQSTHPYRVRPERISYSQLPVGFQSTHPYRVRRNCVHFCLFHNSVSIHAPVQGATELRRQRGAFRNSFNPRTRTGCDLPSTEICMPLAVFQSTHPYRVRRFLNSIAYITHTRFNPRTRTGCDPF